SPLLGRCYCPTPPPHSFPTRRSSDLEHGLVVDFLGLDIATQHRTHTRQKLTRGVGLRHIVIGAEFESHDLVDLRVLGREHDDRQDRKSTRLNSSHVSISYAVFCLKKK